MARRIVPTEFVPEGYCADGLLLPERRSIFGVRFTIEGERQIQRAIDLEEGEPTEDDVDSDGDDDEEGRQRRLDSIMRWSAIRTFGERTLRKHYGYVDWITDDIYVHRAKELGIDWRKFEHNRSKIPIDGFLDIARKVLRPFELASNETRWKIQERKLLAAFENWVEKRCEESACPECCHRRCEEAYGQPNFWAIAKAVYEDRRETQKLLSTIDARPRGKAVKIANDALARIAIASRRGTPNTSARRGESK